MSQIVPLQAVPSQIVNVTLNNQNCQLEVFQKNTGMFINVYIDNALIIGGVICENANVIVRSTYLGFIGDLAFVDTQPNLISGPADPTYDGLGTRFVLEYLFPADLPSGLA